MASFAMQRVTPRVSAPAASPRVGAVRVPRVVVFAQEPRFSLDNNKQTAEGYVEKDTAGQSNMYPTIMKPFEAGSAADTVQQDSFNNGVAVGGSVLALGAIGLGLTALINTNSAPVVEAEDFSAYQSLTAYSAAFTAELAPPKPAIAEVVVAPVLEAVSVPVTEPVAVPAEEVKAVEEAAPESQAAIVLEAEVSNPL